MQQRSQPGIKSGTTPSYKGKHATNHIVGMRILSSLKRLCQLLLQGMVGIMHSAVGTVCQNLSLYA